MRKIKQYTRAEIREITLKRFKERHKKDKKVKEKKWIYVRIANTYGKDVISFIVIMIATFHIVNIKKSANILKKVLMWDIGTQKIMIINIDRIIGGITWRKE